MRSNEVIFVKCFIPSLLINEFRPICKKEMLVKYLISIFSIELLDWKTKEVRLENLLRNEEV